MEQTLHTLIDPTLTRNRVAGSVAQRPHQRLPKYVRPLLLAAMLIGAVLVVHLTPARAWLSDVSALRDAAHRAGAWTYPIAFFLTALLIACGVPRLLLCALAGSLFGFWIGLGIALLASVLGHWCVFRIVRWAGREWTMNHWPTLVKWTAIMHSHGTFGVIVARLLPAHAILVNLALGLSDVKIRHFLLGSLIGLLPEAIAATLLGAGVINVSLSNSVGYIVLGFAVLGATWIACGSVIRSLRERGESIDDD